MSAVVAGNPKGQALGRFLGVYARLNAGNLELLDGIYHPEVIFVDPMRRVDGLPELKRHFAALYRNLMSCHFDFSTTVDDGSASTVEWHMHYRHGSVRRGRTISVHGCSLLRFDGDSGLAITHHDFFDMGAMLYEHLPIIGTVVGAIKRRAGA